jgi:hypothetical protein
MSKGSKGGRKCLEDMEEEELEQDLAEVQAAAEEQAEVWVSVFAEAHRRGRMLV